MRLALSLASAARSADLPGVTTARMLEEMVDGYRTALRTPEDEDLVAEPGVVATVRRDAIGRRWRELAQERLDGVRPKLPLGKKFWALSDDERDGLAALFDDPGVHEHVLALQGARPARSSWWTPPTG